MKHTGLCSKTIMHLILAALGCFASFAVDACTAFVVGKKASATGHVIVGHNNDGFGPMRYAILPPTDSAPALQEIGRTGGLGGGKSSAIYWQAVYSDKAKVGKATGDVLLNEHGVIMFSNSGGYLREWGAAHSETDPWQAGADVVDGGLGLALRFEVVRRARSAAEGVKIATSLIDRYGYGPDARTFTIADRDEAWILCAVHGRRYVARRCPDDAVMAYPNILPVGRILPGDIVSEEMAAKRDTFDFAAAYQGVRTKHDSSQRHRIIEFYRIAAGVDVDENELPWSVKPAHLVSVDDLKRGFSSHAVGRDAVNVHPEEVPGASWPICRLRTLENVVCQFAADPLETRISLAPGRPCETKYDEFRPFRDAAPSYFATGAEAESLLAGRLQAPPVHVGETLYNGIVLPDQWPPRIDAMFPGPTTPPYLKSPPAAIQIDVGRQLFVDDFLVASSEGVVRKFYKPVKFEGNPVLWPETDEELARWTELGDRPYPADATTAQVWNPMYKSVPACCLSGGGVWWDPKRSKFRMWYLASWSGLLALAESDDAVHWTRPKVGPRGTNVLIYPDHYFDTFSVWPDFTTSAPYENWRMFVSPGENPCRAYEYASADGVNWTLKTRTGLGGDSSTVFFNPFRRKWVWSIRAAWRLRSRMYREHDDFFAGAAWDFGTFTSEQKTGADPLFYRANRWSNTKDCYLWLACDYDDVPREIDGSRRRCELYNVDAVPYESVMVGLFKILSGRDNDEAAQHGMPKTTTIHFAYSRDGFNFTRPDRTPAIPDADWESGCWDSGYLSPCSSGFVIKDERLLFFYNAARGDATMKSEKCRLANGLHANISIGFASLRRDGFAGIVADGAGELVTRPVLFSGSHLFVNADARFGALSAEVVDADGKPFPGYAAADCDGLVRVDSTKRAVSWKGGDLSRFAGKPVRFRFKMKVATLYAFWVSKDASGKSGGYLAAGGPDYSGHKDE